MDNNSNASSGTNDPISPFVLNKSCPQLEISNNKEKVLKDNIERE